MNEGTLSPTMLCCNMINQPAFCLK